MAHRVARIQAHLNPPREPRVPWELRTAGMLLNLAGPSAAFFAGKFKEWVTEKGVSLTQSAYNRFLESRQGRSALRGYKMKKIISRSNKPMVALRKKKYSRRKTTKTSKGKFSQQKNGQTIRKKTYKRTYRKKVPLQKQVKELKKLVVSDQAYHTYKYFTTFVCTSAVAKCSHTNVAINPVTFIETFCSQLRYYDPSAPGTLVTAAAGTGTYSRLVHFKNIYSKLELRNSYQVPCRVKVYLCKAKADTAISPLSYYTDGITDQVISGGDATTPGIHLTDIDTLTEQFSIKCLKDVILDTGASCSVSASTGTFDYDPALVDTHALTYQKKYKSITFVIRVEGVIGHDTAAAEYTNTASGVDVIQSIVANIVYDAGVNLNDIYIQDARSASFTNAGVVANKPVSDNQSYSVA